MGIDPSRGFVAIPRGLTDWEWYSEPNTARLFIHLLLTSNWQEKQWQGITIHPGELVTSRAKLAKQLRMSEQSVRTALMKREDVKAKLPGITDEQLNWLMSENGADINREKTVAEQFKTQFENAQAQLKTAQDGLAKFDGKKTPDEYEAELTKLRGDMQAQADGFAFDSALNTAIMGKKGRSVKAVRALLDVDGLKSSKDRTTDIDKALEEAAKA